MASTANVQECRVGQKKDPIIKEGRAELLSHHFYTYKDRFPRNFSIIQDFKTQATGFPLHYMSILVFLKKFFLTSHRYCFHFIHRTWYLRLQCPWLLLIFGILETFFIIVTLTICLFTWDENVTCKKDITIINKPAHFTVKELIYTGHDTVYESVQLKN